MKKLLYLLLNFFLITTTLNVTSVQAASQANTTAYTFSALGLSTDMVLHGPYDANSFRFGLPPAWKLQSGGELDLQISAYTATNNPSGTTDNNGFSGVLLDVYFNDKLLQSVPLTLGNNIPYQIPISPDSLAASDPNGTQKISFFLDAAIDCQLDNHKTTVVIGTSSKALFSHDDAALSLDLRRLPWPIYQQNSVEKNAAVVVVPDSPSIEEMQAGLVVTAAFGRMTNGNLPVTLLTDAQLTDTLKSQSDLIVVGKPSAFSFLSDTPLTVPLVNGKYSSSNLQEDDGVLQAIVSPWNSSRTLLIASGNTDAGVLKAAQALSTSNLQTGDTPDYSIIANVNPATVTGIDTSGLVPVSSSDVTFSDLGYDSITVSGIGANWLSYDFIIPSEEMPSENPYVDIKYSVSASVDSARSSGDVYLDDVLVGSLSLAPQDTSSSINTTRISLPASVLRSGSNRIDVVINLLPNNDCSAFAFSGLWVTIYPDSVLHLPLTAVTSTSLSNQEIKSYPFPIANDSSLNTMAFVLSQKDKASWTIAGQVAYDLGVRVAGPIVGFGAAFSDQMTNDIRNRNLIVIGEPKNLNIISDLRNVLPAYFENNSNIAILSTQQVIYRISEKKDLGYLELFTSSWNPSSMVLGIFGTSSSGLESAVSSLLNPKTLNNLAGNFVTVDGTKAVTVDTRTGLGMGQLETQLDPSILSTPTPEAVVPGASAIDQAQIDVAHVKAEIIVGIVGVLALTVMVIGMALWRNKRKT